LLFLFIRFKYIPKHSIEGTQRPIKIAWSEFPLKNKTSEYMRESIAAKNSSLSVKVNFLNMLFSFKTFLKVVILFVVNLLCKPFINLVLVCYVDFLIQNIVQACRITVCGLGEGGDFTTNVDAENQTLSNHKCVCGALNRHFCQTRVMGSGFLWSKVWRVKFALSPVRWLASSFLF